MLWPGSYLISRSFYGLCISLQYLQPLSILIECSLSRVIKVSLFFFSLTRIKKGYPYEARVIARVLPAFLADFFPPQDIMNKVIGEFLSSQQPYPQLIAKVVFQVKSIFLFYKRTVKQFHSRQITASLVFVYFLIKVYIVGTHLNCIDLSIHFKCVPTLYAFIKKIRRKKNIKVYFIYLPYLSLTYLS